MLTMIKNIKKICGITNNEFDSIISMQIESAKNDLIMCGIVPSKVVETDSLIYSAIVSYVKSFIDVNNAELYRNAYMLQKDALKHYEEYIKEA